MTVPLHAPSLETAEELTTHLFDELELRCEEVARRSFDAIIDAVPAYRDIDDPGLVESVYCHGAEHIVTVARAMRENRLPTRDELDFVRVHAAQRAGTVPLEALLHGYRIGHRVVWEWLLAEVGDQPTAGEVAGHLVTRIGQCTDAISVVATESYIREQQRRITERDRERRDLLDDMLAGRFTAGADAPARAAALGLESGGEFLVVVALTRDPTDCAATLQLAGEAIGEHGTVQRNAAFVVVRHNEVIALVPLENRTVRGIRSQVERALMAVRPRSWAPLTAGVSTTCSGLGDFPRGYDEARRALRLTDPERPVVALADVSLLDYLVAHADATAAQIVGPGVRRLLEEDERQEGVLVETLDAYLGADLNVVRAAQGLGVHPNTVHYRLGRIGQLTGINARRVTDLIDTLTAVRVTRWASRDCARDGGSPSMTRGC